MRKFLNSTLAGLLLAMTVVTGCKEAQTPYDPNNPSAGSGNISVALSENKAEGFESTSATFDIEATGYESFAYKVSDGKVSDATSGAVIFADASEVISLSADKMSYTIYGLEGAESYTAEFAFKVKDQNKYEVKAVEFTTDDYSEKLIHVIEAEQFSLKFTINMPEGVKYRYSLVDRSNYEMNRLQYAWDDITYLKYGVKADGRKDVEVHDGDVIGKDADDMEITQLVKPGMSFVVLVVECDDNYNPKFEQVNFEAAPSNTRVDKPNVGSYTEECSDTNIKMTGIYAKQYFTTKQPYPAEGDVVAEITTTQRKATLTFAPSEEVVRYGYSIWVDQEIENVRKIIGEDGLITALQSDFIPETEASEITVGIQMGVNYTLAILYISDEDETTRSVKMIPFSATESDKPVSVIEVTPATSQTLLADGSVSPYLVAFNIKAVNKDCKRIRLAMDYTRNFVTQSNQSEGSKEQNITDLVLNYGLEYTQADNMEVFNQINSDEGFIIEFDSFEDTESTLAVLSLNDDDKEYLSYCTSRSAVEPAKEPLSTPEFENLDGDWTATYKYNADWDEAGAAPRVNTFKVTITNDPGFGAPETFDSNSPEYDRIHEFYVGRGMKMGESDPETYATNQIEADFQEFKKLCVKFKEKNVAQNRKFIYGFELDEDMGVVNHTPWQLFCDLNYSSYDVEQLFYDFGPKMYIDVLEDQNGEKVIRMVNNQAIVSPFYTYYGSTNSVAGLSLSAWEDFGYEEQAGIIAGSEGLPLVIEDNDHIYLGSIVDEHGNNDYYLSLFYSLMGADLILAVGHDYLRMERGYDEPASVCPPLAPRYVKGVTDKKVPSYTGHKFKRMYMPNRL